MGQIAKSDAELVEASRRGERDAFGHLVSRYQQVVCAVSYSSTGDWATSEDVAQDTFVAAWRQLGQLRETTRLRSWLCGIARNLARKARKRTDHDELAGETLPAHGGTPFDHTAQAEADRVVREALARVPDTYREPLVLYYCENHSVREVAEALGIGEDATMQRLSRGRRYLADGVTDLVERSLRGARTRRNLAAAVLAAIPLTAIPSRVDAASTGKGSTMLKIGFAAALLAAAGTTALVVHETRGSSPPPTTTASAATPVAAARPRAVFKHAVAPSLGAAAGAQVPQLPPGAVIVDDNPNPVGKDTIARLALDQGPARGPANAPVTIILFQDLMCTYCGKVLGTLDQLWDEYPNQLRLVVKQFPVHTQARLAAEASFAADAQGKFWELHDLMIAHQEDLSRDALLEYGKQAGLDVARLADDLDHHTYAKALATDVSSAKEIGVRATPEFLINGHDFTGARPIEDFRAAIDAALDEH